MFFSSIHLWQKLVEWDQQLFILINSHTVNPFFDAIMPYCRYPMNWAPFYLFILVFVLLNFRTRGLWWIVFFLVTVALTDMTGTYVFKHGFERLRPCRDPGFYEHVRLLVEQCGAGFSFVSNHAANHFAMATFFFITFRHRFPRQAWLLFPWAFLVAFAQVYVGLHYPLDVIVGALLGVAFGITTGSFFNKRFGFAIFDGQPTE